LSDKKRTCISELGLRKATIYISQVVVPAEIILWEGSWRFVDNLGKFLGDFSVLWKGTLRISTEITLLTRLQGLSPSLPRHNKLQPRRKNVALLSNIEGVRRKLPEVALQSSSI
jgi:hypothetical protein